MRENLTGRIVLKTPFICECCTKIDGVYQTLNPFKKHHMIELSYGKHSINVGINYDEIPESSRVHSSNTWAWENDKMIEVNENDIIIEVKRKWHLLKPVTTEAQIKSR